MRNVVNGTSVKVFVSSAIMMALALVMAPQAEASGITFSIIAPHEYNLPVDFDKSLDLLIQYGEWNNLDKKFDNNGNKVDMKSTDTYVGVTKYARFFNYKSLPGVAFAWEAIIPEVSIRSTGQSDNGLGDPITGLLAWIKPTKNTVFGVQNYLQLPFGTEKVSDNTFKTLPSIFWDAQFGDLNFDGDAGFVIQSKDTKNNIEPGSTFHSNIRLGYRVHKYVEPYFSLDYQTTGSTKNSLTGSDIANSKSNELGLGGGLMVNFSDSVSLSAKYQYGVDGKNTAVTNGLSFKWCYVF
jgi:hypothetical protein